MTDQRELDRLLDAFFVAGTDKLPGRVIEAALLQIDHAHQRRALPLPQRFPPMTTPLRAATIAALALLAVAGTLYVMGPSRPVIGPGSTPSLSPSPEASPSAGPSASPVPQGAPVWTITGEMAKPHAWHTATLLPDGSVLVAGHAGTDPNSGEIYDPATANWTATGNMNAGRYAFTATLLPDGKVLVTGGVGPDGGQLASAELYDPGSRAWTDTGAMIETRGVHTATLLPDGMVLVTGGSHGDGALASAELYDPRTGTWTATGSMSQERSGHTATRLAEGKVLVAGGTSRTDGAAVGTAELYDPASGTWSATGGMTDARTYHIAVPLPDGTALVSGGVPRSDGPSPLLASAELYDPALGTWTPTGRMIDVRNDFAATLLSDGRVLVVGSASSTLEGDGLASAELYDPRSGTWTATWSMKAARWFHTATLLVDGTVLVAGGAGDTGLLSSAELYDPRIRN